MKKLLILNAVTLLALSAQTPTSQAREGRMHILGLMQQALPHARAEISQHAPRMFSFKINPEKIRDVIGKGGAVIRAITEETGTSPLAWQGARLSKAIAGFLQGDADWG